MSAALCKPREYCSLWFVLSCVLLISVNVLVLVLFTEEEVLQLHTKVDLVITLGGDGTVLWVIFLKNHFIFLGTGLSID